MSSIKPLDSHSVHKLCSSQVVVSLGIAIKELLENSIDAGAKRIEIKLKNYGCDAVEVIDDGSGIQEENFSTLGKKHSTSKISTFEDLVSVTSFGFRGEALNSLCHLADITIHTRAADAVCGTRLVFDNSGTIKSRHPLARSRGTTVCLERLFHTLPVRRRHLTDKMRLMKEFSKAVNLITAYCLAKVGLQISCYRFDAKGEKVLVVSNSTARSTAENFAAVYGQTQLKALIEIPSDFEVTPEVREEYNVKLSAEELDAIRVAGFISAPPSSSGTTGRSSADRQFVCVNGRPCEFPQVTRLATDLWRRCCRESLAASLLPSRSATSNFPVLLLLLDLPPAKVDVNLSPDKRQLLLQWERPLVMKVKAAILATLLRALGNYVNVDPNCQRNITSLMPSPTVKCTPKTDGKEPCISSPVADTFLSPAVVPTQLSQQPLISTHLTQIPTSPSTPLRKRARSPSDPLSSDIPTKSSLSPDILKSLPTVNTSAYDRHLSSLTRRTVKVPFSLNRLRHFWHSHPWEGTQSHNLPSAASVGNFRAALTEPAAESELTISFNKTWFESMRVIGQFNRGFIVCQYEQDLFIVDQHASDEKNRFEYFLSNHQFTSQPLVAPQQLQLTALQEQILDEYMDVFKKNGFAFSSDEEAPMGQRYCLVASPMSEGKIFGSSDVIEMLFVLAENPVSC
uniref:Mismatch repair endonuclease PMS2 n=1 Tax=Schistocephalus solidus TaxID=70667 RepID=A0A0X3PH84_SCHSO